ncbi:hypothetical protein BOTBODRAFT_180832 [Botryobasidium botryosum FD-172 SS1]|uniref:methionyl-tRNA formyltransferase n=1 Tax=Botryobasidium botryosum (strain FD-172 SS1) TaxID=930990 RepID=A0A067M660_BOTB1|nr:hypothetical protein BOTBODRAFT_180832 [Botryobasidium botryosum FD-172 SS1]
MLALSFRRVSVLNRLLSGPFFLKNGHERRFLHGTREPFKVLFFGRDEFSCSVLEVLHKAPRDIIQGIWVITTLDQRVGRRGRSLSVAPLKLLSQEINLPTSFVPNETSELASWSPPHPFDQPSPSHLLLTASFGRAIPTSILDLFKPSQRLNIHPSLIPEFRGAAPMERTIEAGLTETGVSVIQMEDIKGGFDVGDVWGQRPVTISPTATFQSIQPILAKEGAELLIQVLRDMLAGEAVSTPQDPALATTARLIRPRHCHVDWSTWDAPKVERLHRAFSCRRPLYSALPTSPPTILQLHSISLPSPDTPLHKRLTSPGDAIFSPEDRAIVARCANNTDVHVRLLQRGNRGSLVAKEWWNGMRPEWLKDGVLKLIRLEEE